MPENLVSLTEWCRRNRQHYIRAWSLVTQGMLPAQKVAGRLYVAADLKPPPAPRRPSVPVPERKP